MAVMIFSSLIFAMIFNNAVENVKLKKETMAMIYITEIFETIGSNTSIIFHTYSLTFILCIVQLYSTPFTLYDSVTVIFFAIFLLFIKVTQYLKNYLFYQRVT